jgi:hypothetical protein
MRATFRIHSLAILVLVNLVPVVLFFVVLNNLLFLRIIPCADNWAQSLVLALLLALVIQIFLVPRIFPGHYKIIFGVYIVLILIILWLGLYPVSPLGYSTGRISALRGFVVMTNRKGITNVPLEGVITLGANAIVGVSPLTITDVVRCRWVSVNGGSLDGSNTCNIAYMAPQADYDILRVSIQPGCGLPASTGQFKISILP